MSHIKYVCLSLQNPTRMKLYEHNKKLLPQLELVKSINGYNIPETVSEFRKTGLKYFGVDDLFQNYGTIACFLTKYKCLMSQIENAYPYLCFIEDDMLLKPGFERHVHQQVGVLERDKAINMIRLGPWGEGYITSLASARRLVDIIKRSGIIANIDNQLRKHCGKEVYAPNTPWRATALNGDGDIKKTKFFGRSLHKLKFKGLIYGQRD